MSSHIDSQLVEKIVLEVKSQGVFDEFRKDSISDVDTKPAYQNLRQRVESTVEKFLSGQKWTPDLNKNQLREKLRRHITESGFLDVGVVRIVDQVVDPKIRSVFQPRIEDIAYKYLGIAPPKITPEVPIIPPFPPLPMNGAPLKIETSNLLPNDLEQVSPDSDEVTEKSDSKDEVIDMDIDMDEKEEDESPPFEPLMRETCLNVPKEEISARCLLTPLSSPHSKDQGVEDINLPKTQENLSHNMDVETQDNSMSIDCSVEMEIDSEKEASQSLESIAAISQQNESKLSQVSSDSRLSTRSNTADNKSINNAPVLDDAAVNISEEAQMPKFNENSSEGVNANANEKDSQLHFDIKKDEIKFEGTERKSNLALGSDKSGYESPEVKGNENIAEDPVLSDKKDKVEENNSFKFGRFRVTNEILDGIDSSLESSLEDTSSGQLCIAEGTKSDPITPPTSEQNSENKVISNNPSIAPSSYRHNNSSHSSSVRSHHKHSRDSHRSHGKSAHKSRDKDSSKDRHSSSKYSFNSSKHSSSINKDSDRDKSRKSSSKPNISSSSRSSSRSDGHSYKRDKHDDKKKGHSSLSTKESSESTNGKKNERKPETFNDDHNESKDKARRRKSTDSNDDNGRNSGFKSTGSRSNAEISPSVAVAQSKSKTKHSNGTDRHSSKTTHNDSYNNEHKQDNCQPQSNIVILNDILQNPYTNFIDLESGSYNSKVQVVSNIQPCTLTSSSDITDFNKDLLYFEKPETDVLTSIIDILDNLIDGYRNVITALRFNSWDDGYINLSENEKLDEQSVKDDDVQIKSSPIKELEPLETKTSLTIDCIVSSTKATEQIDYELDSTKPPRKRYRHAKTSPTPSETSVNSKENEALDKNTAELRNMIKINKIKQQRYTSDDLYKPRPVLRLRTKRRGGEIWSQ